MLARSFFLSVREAAKDAERCRTVLDIMEYQSLRIGTSNFGPRVRMTETGGLANRVGALVDREAALHKRIEEDYQLIDKAVAVLYGDELNGGLASLAPSWWADALDLYYIECLSWAKVGQKLGYSHDYARKCGQAGLDLIDANGLVATEMGRGFATDQ